MGSILPFTTVRRRRVRPVQPVGARGEIVIFSGVRIERSEPPQKGVPVKAG